MKKTLSFCFAVLLALIGACAPGEEISAASSVSVTLRVEDKELPEVKYYLDGVRFGVMKRGNDGVLSATLAVTQGTHTLKLFSKEGNVSANVKVTANAFRVCHRSGDDVLLFAAPITADQVCPDLLVEEIKIGMHLASQETSLPPLADEATFRELIKYQLPFVIVDVECLGIEACRGKLGELKTQGSRILTYINPQELMLGDAINDRPLQKQLFEYVQAHAPNWLMRGTDGQPLVLWKVPPMQTLNLSRTSPTYGGLTWGQYFVNYYLGIVSQHADVVDGILFDNAKAFISYEPLLKLYDPATGRQLNSFETDDSWRNGYRDMLTYFHDQLRYYPQLSAGQEFFTAVVSKQSDFSDLADVVIFESPFYSDVGALTQDFHPFAVVDQYIRMAAKSRIVIVEHCIADTECQKWFYPKDHGRETGYALTLLADNSMYVFDQMGPLSHHGFTFDPIYRVSGKAVSGAQYPYLPVYTKAEKQTLTNGQSITIPQARKGDVIRFSYRINGSFGKSSLHHSDETPEERSKPTQWVDGTVNGFVKSDGDYVISFSGEGSADVWDIMQLDPSQTNSDFLFCREYEQVKACFNPSETETRSMEFAGQTADVPPLQGRVLGR